MPEGVALALLLKVIELEGDKQRNEPLEEWILDAYAKCLSAAKGERSTTNAIRRLMN